MTRDAVFEIVKNNITLVLPSIKSGSVNPGTSLEELGADSVDRSDISIGAMEALGLNLPLVELGKPRTIGALVDLLYGARNP